MIEDDETGLAARALVDYLDHKEGWRGRGLDEIPQDELETIVAPFIVRAALASRDGFEVIQHSLATVEEMVAPVIGRAREEITTRNRPGGIQATKT